jgi:hypothetical protein
MSPGKVGKDNCPFSGKQNCQFCQWIAVTDTTAIAGLRYTNWTQLPEQVEKSDDPFRASQKHLLAIYSVSVVHRSLAVSAATLLPN